MAVKIKTVAEMAGVSITTVSFVLNDKHPQVDGLSEETRQRVRACATALGYRRNPTAVSLRSGKSLWVGVMIQPVRDEGEGQAWAPYELTLISGVENALFDLGYFPVLASKSTTGDTYALDTLAHSGVAGMILRRPLREEVKRVDELRKEGLACIAVFPRRKQDLYPYQIDMDNVKAGAVGAELLCQSKNCRPAVISVGSGDAEQARIQGFIKETKQMLGRDPLVCDVSDIRDGAVKLAKLTQFLKEHTPSSVLATEAGAASHISFAAEKAGIKVPEDLWIVGFDCFSFKSAREQVVSSISTSWWDAGRLAAQSVVDIAQNGTVWTEPKILRPRFIPGDTTPAGLSVQNNQLASR